MATLTDLGQTVNTTAGSHTVVATPAAGDLIIIILANTGYTGTVLPTDNNSDGQGTYTLVTSCVKATSADTMQVYVRNAPIGSATSTTFTGPGASSTGGGLIVYKLPGIQMNYGLAAIRQSAIQSNQAAAGTPAPAFANAALTGNPVITAVFNATNPAAVVVRASPLYTSDTNTGYATPTTGFISSHVNSGETGTTITWGGTSLTAFCSVAIELDTAAATPSLTNLQQYDSDLLTPLGIGDRSATGAASGISLEMDMVPFKETLNLDILDAKFESQNLDTALANTATNTAKDIKYDPTGPIPTRGAGFCYDTTRQRFLMFGGANGSNSQNTVHEFRIIGGKGKWRRLFPTGTAPSVRYQGAAIYDAVNDRMITVFGFTTVDTNELWSLSFTGGDDGAWTQLTSFTGTAPAIRSNITQSVCNDPTNQCFYVVCGWGASFYNGVYKFVYTTTAGAWSNLSADGAASPAPTGRRNACAVLDSVNGRILVTFGNINTTTGTQNDLHAFQINTTTWTILSPTGGPPSVRERAWGAYDPNTQKAYFGMGDNDNTAAPIQDYWQLDTSTTNCVWTEKDPVSTSAGYMPTGAYLCNAQFNPDLKLITIYNGGVDITADLEKAIQIIDTTESTPWLYAMLQNDFMRPRDATTSIYNPDWNEAIAIGGYSQMDDNATIIDGGHVNDIFVYNYPTNSWRVASKGIKAMMIREGVMAVYDTVRDRVIAFGGLWGSGGAAKGTFNDVWEIKRDLNGNYGFKRLVPTGTLPGARWLGAAAFDATNNRVIITCGSDGGASNFNDCWKLDFSSSADGAWTSLSPTGTPPTAAWGLGFINDPDNNNLYVFGGATSAGDTTYSGQFLKLSYAGATPAWSALSTTSAPSARRSMNLGLDHANGKIIVFGGYTGSVQQDINYYDIAGNTWSGAATPGTSPGARRSHGGWFDPINAVYMITHGRVSSGTWFGDTWQLTPNYATPSSSTWVNKSPAHYIRGQALITGQSSNSYHWQGWVTDTSGQGGSTDSTKTSYGNNPETNPDYILGSAYRYQPPISTTPFIGPLALQRPPFRRSFLQAVSATAGTLYTQTLTAAVSFTGAFTKQTNYPLAGVLSFTGSLTKSISRALSATFSFTGTFFKLTNRLLVAAGLSFTGAFSKRVNKPLAATLSFTGSMSKAIAHTLTATLSFSGALTRFISRSLASAAVSFTGSISKTTNRALSGALSFTGAFSRQIGKALSGVLSFSGTISKAIAHTLTASLSFTGNIIKGISHTLTSAALSFTGSIKKTTNRSLSGTLSFTGAMARAISHTLTATLSFTGSMAKVVFYPLTATLSFTGSMFKQIQRAFTATLSFTGAIAAGKFLHQALTGTLSFTGSFSKTTLKALTATLSFSGAMARSIAHVLNASVSFSGSLAKKTLRSLTAAAVSFSGAFVKTTQKSLTGTLSFTGSIVRLIGKSLVATLSFTGSMAKLIFYPLTATLSFSGSMVKRLARSLSGTLSFAGLLTHIPGKIFNTTVSFTGAFTKQINKTLPATLSFTGNMAKLIFYPLTATLSFTGSMFKQLQRAFVATLSFTGVFTASKSLHQAFTATLSFTGNFSKTTLKNLVATLSFSGSMARLISHTLTATLSFTGAFTKRIARSLTAATLSFSGSFTKQLNRTFAATLSFTGAFSKRVARSFAATLSFTGSFTRQIARPFTATLSFTGSFFRTIYRSFAGTLTFTGSFIKRVNKSFVATVGFNGSMFKRIGKTLNASVGFSGSMVRGIYKSLVAGLNFTGSFTRTIARSLTATLSFTGLFSKIKSGIITAIPGLGIFLGSKNQNRVDLTTKEQNKLQLDTKNQNRVDLGTKEADRVNLDDDNDNVTFL